MSARRVFVGVVASVVVAALVAGGWYLFNGRGREVSTPDGRLLIGERDRGGMDSLFQGPVNVNDGGCIGAHDVTVIWPHGTDVVDRDPLVLRVPGNGKVRLGERVELGGGFVFEPSSDGEPRRLEVGGVTVPKACSAFGVFLAD